MIPLTREQRAEVREGLIRAYEALTHGGLAGNMPATTEWTKVAVAQAVSIYATDLQEYSVWQGRKRTHLERARELESEE